MAKPSRYVGVVAGLGVVAAAAILSIEPLLAHRGWQRPPPPRGGNLEPLVIAASKAGDLIGRRMGADAA
ncbi:MAG: hypothetical protein ACRD12_00255 [Acidimicrobiales bacterium]